MSILQGDDGRVYKALTREEAIGICQDIQMYIGTRDGDELQAVSESGHTPNVCRQTARASARLISNWYADGFCYYVPVDSNTKEEYTP